MNYCKSTKTYFSCSVFFLTYISFLVLNDLTPSFYTYVSTVWYNPSNLTFLSRSNTGQVTFWTDKMAQIPSLDSNLTNAASSSFKFTWKKIGAEGEAMALTLWLKSVIWKISCLYKSIVKLTFLKLEVDTVI